MIRRGCIISVCLSLLVALSGVRALLAQDSALPAFRRVFVPQEALVSQSGGLLPMKRAEFDRVVQAATAGRGPARLPPGMRVEEALFRTRLSGHRLEKGSARLSIVALNSESPALVELAPCNLALTGARWATSDEVAVLGMSAKGELQCLVNASGELELDWTLAASTTTAGSAEFRLELPAAARRRLELVCDAGTEISLVGGVCQAPPPPASAPTERTWLFELTGAGPVILQAHSPNLATDHPPPWLVRESSIYSLWPSSLDLEATLHCESPELAAKELQLRLESPLVPLAVQVDERPVPFEIRELTEPFGGRIVSVPVAQGSTPRHTIHVAATAVWTLAGAKRLPRMLLADSLLQEARREITAPEWMQIVARPSGSCVQVQAAAAAGGRAAERFVFQVYAADGGIEIDPTQPDSPLEERSGLQITADGNQIVGMLVAELRGTGRETFDVEAEVPRQWIVDSVEAVPATMLADRALSARGAGPQRLQLKLAQPIEQGRTLRLIVRGHFRRPTGGELRGPAAFQLARFPAVGVSRRLISLRVNDPGVELSVAGDESLLRHSAEELPAEDRELFESPPVGLVFEAVSGVDELAASLKAARASYRAEVSLRADVDKAASNQTATLRCLPEGATVGAIIVRMAPRPQSPVRWQLIGDETRELAATIEGDPSNDEAVVYRLALPRAFSAPIDIRGQWSSAAPGPLSLLWLPEASRQTSVVEIRSPLPNVEFETQGLSALPLPANAGEDARCQARYSYEAGQQARLSVRMFAEPAPAPAAWIESLRVTSHIALKGGVKNEAELIIRNAATDRLVVNLPQGITECHLSSRQQDDVLLPVDAGVLLVPLAAGPDSQRVVLSYLSPPVAGSNWPIRRFTPAVPRFQVPVLARTWNASLAPGLAPVSLGEQWQRESVPLAMPPAGDRATRLRPPGQWTNLAMHLSGLELLAKSGWLQVPAGKRSGSAAFSDWQVFSRELRDSEIPSITVFRRPVLLAWSLAAVLALVPLGAGLARAPAWLFTFAAALLAGVFAFHPPWSWLLLGALVGLLLGLAIRRVRGWPSLRAGQTPYAWAGSEAAAALVVWLALAGGARLLEGAPLAGAPAAEAQTAHRAVYPVDEESRPVGEYVYLTPELYDAVQRWSSNNRSISSDWLIASARYECHEFSQVSTDSPAMINVRANLRIHTLRNNALVQLPIRRQQLFLEPNSARLDGSQAPLTWDEAGEALLLTLPLAGEHELVLTLAAAAQQIGDEMVFAAAIPPAAMSYFELPRRAAIPGLQINGRQPAIAADTPPDPLPLGAVDQLEIRWPAQGTAAPARAAEAEQLAWWKIRPASAVLEVQVRLRSSGEPIRALRLQVDPRLRPLASLTTGDVGRIVVEDENAGLVLVELVQPAEEARVRLGWLWPEAPTLGTLVLPEVHVLPELHREVAPASRRWTAASIESGLELQELGGTFDRVEPADFARAWAGDASLLPAFAVMSKAGLGSAERLRVTTRPLATAMQAQQDVYCTFSRSAVTAIVRFDLSGIARTCFEHQVHLPATWKAAQVRLLQNDRQAAIRWRQDDTGLLRLMLLEPPAPTAVLTVEATLAARPATNRIELPTWRLEGARTTAATLRIFRHADVKLTIDKHAGWLIELPTPGAESEPQSARHFMSLNAENPVAQTTLVVRRDTNRPHLTGTQVTKVTQADGDWQAEAAWKLKIAAGTLDYLRLYIPADWPEPLSLEPAWPYRSEPTASEGRRLITVFPPSTVRDQVEIRLRGPLSVSTGAIEAPAIHLLDADAIQQWLLLDGGLASQPIQWETRGLAAARMREADELLDVPDHHSVLRVVRDRFRAVARFQPATDRVPQVALAWLDTRTMAPGRVMTVAHYLIIPKGAAELGFEMPPASRLVQVRADDLPLVATQTGLRRWTAPTRSNVLPFELAIACDSAWSPYANATIFSPQLLGFEPEPAIWILPEQDAAAVKLNVAEQPGLSECSPGEAQIARLEGIGRALDAVQSARGAALPPAVLVEAFYRWNDALQSRLADQQPIADGTAAGTELIARQAAVEAAASNVQQRLIQAGILAENAPATTHVAPLSAGQRPSGRHFMVAGPTVGLALAPTSPAETPLPWRAALAVLAIITGIVGPSVARKLAINQPWAASPPILSMLVGICWWLFAPLGWLGWFLVALGLWMLLRRPALRRASLSGSTIQRFSAPS